MREVDGSTSSSAEVKKDWSYTASSQYVFMMWWLMKQDTSVYPKVSGLAAWREGCKWYSSLPLGAVVSLFCESVF
jgi:hypothetical protein